MLAVGYASNDWDVLIADLDTKQATSLDWTRRRADDPHLNPKIQAMAFSTVPAALRVAEKHDLVIFDMPPHSSNGTAELAKACDVMFIPTGTTVDDLVPTVRLLHELVKAGMTAKRIAVIMVRGIDSEAQIAVPPGWPGGWDTSYLDEAGGTRVAKGTITSMSCDPAVNGP